MTIAGGYKNNDPVYLSDMSLYERPKEAFKQLLALVKEDFAGKPFSIVDVGCASGAFLYFVKNQCRVERGLGLDIADALVQQARKVLPELSFEVGSIEEPQPRHAGQFDVATLLGTLCVFDDPEPVLKNLLSLLKPGGIAYVWDFINPDAVDVIVRFRRSEEGPSGEWQRAYNVTSRKTYEKIFKRIAPNADVSFYEFRMPFPIKKGTDPLRSWTVAHGDNPHQVVVGTGQLLSSGFIQVKI